MRMENSVWQVYAVRYAHHERTARENFIGGDPHDESPMPMDYFTWVVVSGERAVAVDTGFDEAMARKRGRNFLRSPGDSLRDIGIDPSRVRDVIISHMHYDHCGNHDLFPAAKYHMQST